MNEYSNLDLKGNIPDFPPEQKRLIVKEGPMRLVEKQVKVSKSTNYLRNCIPHNSSVAQEAIGTFLHNI